MENGTEEKYENGEGVEATPPTAEAVPTAEAPPGAEAVPTAEAAAAPPLSESDMLRGVKILRELIDRMQVNVIITTGGESDTRTIFISGPDSGLLVGKRGQTLDALHFVFNRIVHKQMGVRGFIDLDVDGYRSRREKAIRKMAVDLARKAKQEGKVIPIRPMGARERRIVHLALSEVSGIRTESEGEGKDRHVQIIPLHPKTRSTRSD
jgi:spoIIIJ-associated protein